VSSIAPPVAMGPARDTGSAPLRNDPPSAVSPATSAGIATTPSVTAPAVPLPLEVSSSDVVTTPTLTVPSIDTVLTLPAVTVPDVPKLPVTLPPVPPQLP
jgi:hypothetical protein